MEIKIEEAIERLKSNDKDMYELRFEERSPYQHPDCPNLFFVDKKENPITDEKIITIAEALRTNDNLIKLNLDENKVTDKGAKAIAKALKFNKTLHSLSLDVNEIKNEGAFALAEMLEVNRSLDHLSIMHNYINDEGAIALAEVLKVNKTLKMLNLSYNNITKGGKTFIIADGKRSGVFVLSDSPRKSPNLIDLSRDFITKEEAEFLHNLKYGRITIDIFNNNK